MQAGAISQFYELPADFMQTGEVIAVATSLSPLAGEQSEDLLRWLVAVSLLGNEQLASLVLAPTGRCRLEVIAPAEVDNRTSAAGFGVSFALMFILFFSITMSSGYMLQSVSKEKENRTAEVLLTSLDAAGADDRQGDRAGVSGAVADGDLARRRHAAVQPGRDAAGQPWRRDLAGRLLVYLLLYFLLGYLVYSSALGALGALAPNAREGSQFTFVIILPLLIPLWFNSIFLNDPNGTLATVLSLFPLTAPTTMVTRLASTSVPAWQPVVGLILLAVTALVLRPLWQPASSAPTRCSPTPASTGRGCARSCWGVGRRGRRGGWGLGTGA